MSSSSSSSKKKFILLSSEGEAFEIDEDAAGESQTIKQLIKSECDGDGNVIPLPYVTSPILAKVIEYCKKHAEFDDYSSISKQCHSLAKLSIDEIADKDSEAKDCDSSAKLSTVEIADKDSEAKDCDSSAKLSTVEIADKDSEAKDCDSSAKLSTVEIADKDSEATDCDSSAKLSTVEIADKDSEAKDCHSDAKLSTDEIADKGSEAKHCHSPTKLSIDKVDFDLKAWDAEFVRVDQQTLYHLMVAANYLNIKSLIDLTCISVNDLISGKFVGETREILNIETDLTPEEEEEIRKEK